MLSLQYRLYGTRMSGSSWWILLQALQRSLRMLRIILVPSLLIYFLFRLPITESCSPQHGQDTCSRFLTKNSGNTLFNQLIIWYNNHTVGGASGTFARTMVHQNRSAFLSLWLWCYGHYIHQFPDRQYRQLIDIFHWRKQHPFRTSLALATKGYYFVRVLAMVFYFSIIIMNC